MNDAQSCFYCERCKQPTDGSDFYGVTLREIDDAANPTLSVSTICRTCAADFSRWLHEAPRSGSGPGVGDCIAELTRRSMAERAYDAPVSLPAWLAECEAAWKRKAQ